MAKKLIGKGPKKYHMNNDRQVHECEATVRECKYRDRPHGSLEEVGCEAEALALERFEEERRAKREEFAKRRLAKQRGRGRKAKRTATVASKPVVVEPVSSTPKPSTPKPSAPKPSRT